MIKQNGNNKLVNFGKKVFFTIFSVFVISIIIMNVYNYGYNTVIITKYNSYYYGDTEEEQKFYETAAEVYQGYKNSGSTVSMNLFLATVLVSQNKAGIRIRDIDKDDIHTIFKCMNSDPDISDFSMITYNEEAFRKNIKEKWLTTGKFKDTTEGYTDDQLDNIVDMIFKQKKGYEEIFGEEDMSSPTSTTTGGVCSYTVGGETYSNITVKLLACEGNTYLGSDEEFDFETYIIGVVSQENGNGGYEALKAQAVAARSYALTRPKAMNNAFGIKLEKSGNNSFLSLRSCTLDQVFCNPDKGCWSNVDGGQTGNSSTYSNCTVHSGYDTSKHWTRKALSSDSEIRKAVKETNGEVALDSSGNVVKTSYTNDNQQRWNKMASEGSNYFEILKKDYSSVSTVKSTCTSSNSEAESWKQCDSRWGSNLIGSKTICKVGCMVTSTAIQIARSGTTLNTTDFNPGKFVETVKANGGFNGNDFNVDASTWSSIAPNFKVGGMIDFKSTDTLGSKMKKMQELISQGYYIIARIYHPGQHWVAITNVSGNTATMADPSSDNTDFCGYYNCEGTYGGQPTFGRIYYFKAS